MSHAARHTASNGNSINRKDPLHRVEEMDTHREREKVQESIKRCVCGPGEQSRVICGPHLGGGGGGGMEENGIEREGGTSFRVGLALQRVIAPGGGFGVQRHT